MNDLKDSSTQSHRDFLTFYTQCGRHFKDTFRTPIIFYECDKQQANISFGPLGNFGLATPFSKQQIEKYRIKGQLPDDFQHQQSFPFTIVLGGRFISNSSNKGYKTYLEFDSQYKQAASKYFGSENKCGLILQLSQQANQQYMQQQTISKHKADVEALKDRLAARAARAPRPGPVCRWETCRWPECGFSTGR